MSIYVFRLKDGTLVGWDKFLHFLNGARYEKEKVLGPGGLANVICEVYATRWHPWYREGSEEYLGAHYSNASRWGDFNKPFCEADIDAGIAGDRFQEDYENGKFTINNMDISKYFPKRKPNYYLAD